VLDLSLTRLILSNGGPVLKKNDDMGRVVAAVAVSTDFRQLIDLR
jgi:hypothetical protein